MLHIANLHKTYRLGRTSVPVLRGVDLSLAQGECVAILGASGSGKSTLLHIAGGLDTPDRNPPASISFQGHSLVHAPARRLDRFRAADVGFVFQFYHLLPELSVLQNVLIACMVRRRLAYLPSRADHTRRAASLLDRVGLAHRLKHRPSELSGGERQRVAIARALANDPPLLLADEPTGNLDRATGQKILDLLDDIRRERRQTVLMVTHDPLTAQRADRTIRLEDGRVAPAHPLEPAPSTAR